MKVSFSPPDISMLEIREVCQALKSGWITTGPMTKRFEKEIAEMIGVNKACCLNSQTSCAEMALRLLGVGEGDEVITTAYTYTATASVGTVTGGRAKKENYELKSTTKEFSITVGKLNGGSVKITGKATY